MSPDTPTRENLKESVHGKPLVRHPNIIQYDRCNRCKDKNRVRRKYDIPERNETFKAGERVRLIAIHDPDPTTHMEWELRAVYHLDHPMKDPDDVARPEIAQAYVTARVEPDSWTYEVDCPNEEGAHIYEVEDRLIAYDPEIEWYSPVGDGEEHEPIKEPDENGHITLDPTDPRPNWPKEDNQWRKEIMQEHDDWNDDIPTVDLSETEPL